MREVFNNQNLSIRAMQWQASFANNQRDETGLSTGWVNVLGSTDKPKIAL